MRIASGADITAGGKLLRGCFSKHDGASLKRSRHNTCVGCGPMRLIDRRVVVGDKVSGVNDVFDANRDSMQQAAGRLLIKKPCARECRLGI